MMIKFVFSLLLLGQMVWACRSATFGTQSERYVVKSFDFDVKGGQFFSRGQGVVKSALIFNPNLKPLQWTSKYTSLTFSQIGPDFPFGGMNEEGLTVEALWLADTKTPKASEKPAINESQYIQYILDSAASVNEAMKLTSEIQIEKAIAPIHYFICDASESCAVVEVTESGIQFEKVLKGEDQVIENIMHAEMIKPEKKNKIRESFLEFRNKVKASVSNSFKWLEKVKTSGWSRWQIVYDVKKREAHFQHLDIKGKPGSRWTVKVKNPEATKRSLVFASTGATIWKKEILDDNLKAFADTFPNLKPLIPVLHKYLEKSYGH